MGYKPGHPLLFIGCQPAIEGVRVPRLQHSLARYGMRGLPWGVATFALKTAESGHHKLFLVQRLQNGGGNRYDDRSGRI
jgi:hypothetical protein